MTKMKRDCAIMMTNVETGEVNYALTQVACANAIGCTKQLVSQVLSEKEMFKRFKTAKGWKLEYIDFLEHVCSKISPAVLEYFADKNLKVNNK